MAISQRSAWPAVVAALLFAALFTLLFAPVLAGRTTFVHGDALSVSLPLQQLLAEALAEGRIPLWSGDIYGGHPIFAEGQGGFLHPINLLLFGGVARLGDGSGDALGAGTLYAHGLLHWICAWLAAFGTFGLCRVLGLGTAASVFAGLALAASQDWLGLTGNSAIALATSFAPITLWAVEYWWQDPRPAAAVALGACIAAMGLAGYPQAVHAVAIASGVLLLARADADFWHAPGRHLWTGVLAIAVALGLSAVQLLPTLELVGESVRAAEVELAPPTSALRQLRGMLFGVEDFAAADPGLGSCLVLGLAGLGLGLSRVRMGWLLASVVLLQLGLAEASPLYRALRGVLPGLESFRVTHLYATVALVGIAVLAGFGVERLASAVGRRSRSDGSDAADAAIGVTESPRSLVLRIVGVSAAIGLAAGLCHGEDVVAWSYALPLLAIASIGAARFADRTHWLPALLVVLLLCEIAIARPRHPTVDVAVLRDPPATARFVAGSSDARDYRVVNLPRFFSYIGFVGPDVQGLPSLVRRYLASLAAGSNLLWDVSSMDANLALRLARREAADPLLAQEVRGESPRSPGQRFMDAEGVRWVVAHPGKPGLARARDLEPVFSDEETRFVVRENPSARPRLWLVAEEAARWVPDRVAAAELFASWSDASDARPGPSGGTSADDGTMPLVLEGRPGEGAPSASAPTAAAGEPFRGEIVSARWTDERYEVVVEASRDAWLRVADAPYPGWRAWVDDAPVPVLPANLLARAVPVPAGRHEVRMEFVSTSFRTGALVSIASAMALLFFAARTRHARSRSA